MAQLLLRGLAVLCRCVPCGIVWTYLKVNMAWKLKELIALAIKKRQTDAVFCLNIQNAFNSTSWMRIVETLEKTEVLVYLCSTIQDYFQNWVVLVQTAFGHNKKRDDMRFPIKVSPLTFALKYHLWLHPWRIPHGIKYYLLCWRYPGGYCRGPYSHVLAEVKHCPWGYDLLDRVSQTESSNYKDGSGAVYTLLLV